MSETEILRNKCNELKEIEPAGISHILSYAQGYAAGRAVTKMEEEDAKNKTESNPVFGD